MSRSVLYAILRVVIVLFGLLLTAGGVYVALNLTGAVPPLQLGGSGGASGFSLMLDLAREPIDEKLLWALGAVGALLVGLLLLTLGTKRSAERRAKRLVLSDRGEESAYGGGRVTVTRRSIDDLAAYVAGQVDGVREARPRLSLEDGGWQCHCDVSVLPSASIPETTKTLKQKLHDALEHHTGLPVQAVDVDARLDTATDARRRLR